MSRVKAWLASNLLLLLTAVGVAGGLALGLCLRPLLLSPTRVRLIAYPGELFMRLLKLMILPLVVASLVSGAASLNAKINGKIAARTIVYFLSTSLISSLGAVNRKRIESVKKYFNIFNFSWTAVGCDYPPGKFGDQDDLRLGQRRLWLQS